MFELIHLSKRRFMAIASEFELSPPQVMALRQLDPDEPKPMSELALALRCDNSNVTGIVDRLEDRGLVERRPAEHDRRVKMLVHHRARRAGARSASPRGWTSRPRRWPASRPRTSARCATSCAAPSVAPDTLLRIDGHCATGARAVGTASPRTRPRRGRWIARAALTSGCCSQQGGCQDAVTPCACQALPTVVALSPRSPAACSSAARASANVAVGPR